MYESYSEPGYNAKKLLAGLTFMIITCFALIDGGIQLTFIEFMVFFTLLCAAVACYAINDDLEEIEWYRATGTSRKRRAQS